MRPIKWELIKKKNREKQPNERNRIITTNWLKQSENNKMRITKWDQQNVKNKGRATKKE